MPNFTLTVAGHKQATGTLVVDQPAPPAALYGRIRHDWEVPNFSRPLGRPETVKCKDSEFVPLNEAWQLYWFALLRAARPDYTYEQTLQAWASLVKGDRAFTNGRSYDNGYADYVQGLNLGAAPMMIETIITGGNVVQVLDGGQLYMVGGVQCYKIATQDGSKPPAGHTRAQRPDLVFWATIIRKAKYNGLPIVGRFPQLDGADVPVPFIGASGVNYIQADRVAMLPALEPVPSPYHP